MEANIESAGEAASDAVTGAVLAKSLDTSSHESSMPQARCLNCRAAVTGKYCSVCGQASHPHRSLIALGHDILHGVFHVEGRIWRTIPELFFKPGRLTRRYIDGERAKFIPPLPLFLFSVFFMFAVLSLTSRNTVVTDKGANIVEKWQEGNARATETSQTLIDELRAKQNATTNAEVRTQLAGEIAKLEASLNVMKSLAESKWTSIKPLTEPPADKESSEQPDTDAKGVTSEVNIDFGNPEDDNKWLAALRQAQDNPRLLFYKVKTNIYKFSWALIPISIPFMWVLYFWRRDIHLYDHAIFVTYSMSFMMLFLVLLILARTVGVPTAATASAFGVAVPLHIYKQMRLAYGSSALGASLRLIVLSVFASVILAVFVLGLVVMGLVG
jgi:Protein of unknown function (DUF3667)